MLHDFRIGGPAAAALERMVAGCADVGARVLLVGVPVTSSFRTAFTPAINSSYREFLADICRRHGCRFTDCRACVPDGGFVDAHHLSADGARYFSRLLVREVLDAAVLRRATECDDCGKKVVEVGRK
jgi:hypothetical protein